MSNYLTKIFLSIFCFSFVTHVYAANLNVYEQPCKIINEDDYVTVTIITNSDLAQNSPLTLMVTAYEDEQCTKPYLHYTQYFTINKKQNLNIDLKLNKVTYMSLTDEVTDALNMIKYCDINNWATEKEFEVSGKKCGDFVQLSKNQLFYQIIDFDSSNLKLGLIDTDYNGRSPKNRPIEFDSDVYFKK